MCLAAHMRMSHMPSYIGLRACGIKEHAAHSMLHGSSSLWALRMHEARHQRLRASFSAVHTHSSGSSSSLWALRSVKHAIKGCVFHFPLPTPIHLAFPHHSGSCACMKHAIKDCVLHVPIGSGRAACRSLTRAHNILH